MTTRNELIEIEHAGWDALRTSGEAATAHYATSLADDVLMLLPRPIVRRMSSQPANPSVSLKIFSSTAWR